MFYFEDTTTTQQAAESDDELVILDENARQEFADSLPEEDDSMSITLFNRIRKLI